MTRKTTRDAALSRLFGAEETEEASEEAERLEPHATKEEARPKRRATAKSRGEGTGSGPKFRQEAQPEKEELVEGGSSSVPPGPEPVVAEDPAEEVSPGPSGYIGLGRYVREGGVLERITPYVRPDQAEALRVAVARKRDPRGRDISQIVQTLLDEAGYRGPEAAGPDEP